VTYKKPDFASKCSLIKIFVNPGTTFHSTHPI